MEMINEFLTILKGLNVMQVGIIVFAVLTVWFLPAMIAAVLNPAHAKYILMACVPAGFSIVAWLGVLVWACTGKVFESFKHKVDSSAGKETGNTSIS